MLSPLEACSIEILLSALHAPFGIDVLLIGVVGQVPDAISCIPNKGDQECL